MKIYHEEQQKQKLTQEEKYIPKNQYHSLINTQSHPLSGSTKEIKKDNLKSKLHPAIQPNKNISNIKKKEIVNNKKKKAVISKNLFTGFSIKKDADQAWNNL